MKNQLCIFTAASALLLSGCLNTQNQTTTRAHQNGVQVTETNALGKSVTYTKTLRCDKSVAKVSIAPLKCKASKCKTLPETTGNLAFFVKLAGEDLGPDFSNLGDTMGSMLASSLEQSNCFNVLDREALDELKQEMVLAGNENYTPETADYLITGAITSLVHDVKETGIGNSGMTLGLYSNKQTTAKIGIDVRLIDVNSSSIVYSKTYQSDTSANQYGFGLANTNGSNTVSAAATFGNDLEIEEAVRAVLNKTVFDIIKTKAKGSYSEQQISTLD